MNLISTYQGRKSLFAEKLEDKGVEASATDGLTTLINKIDDIEEGFTEGLLIYAENNIVQKDDTVDLYALLLQDGKPVPNKSVEFVGLWTIVAGRINHVPSHYDVLNVHQGGIAYFDADHHFKLDNYKFYKDDVQQSSIPVHTISLNQNTLTVTYIGGTSSTFDVSSYDMTTIETNSDAMLEMKFYASGTTGSDGVASYTYTGVGDGLRRVYAKYGTLVSETYSLLDCLMFDIATTGQKNNDDWHVQSGTLETPIPVDDNGAKLNNSGSGNSMYVANLHGTTPASLDTEFPLPFAVEFDVVDSNNLGSCYFQCSPETGTPYTPALNSNGSVIGSHHRILFEEGKNTVYIDDREPLVLTRSFSGLCSLRFFIASGTYLKYKNFKVYSI